ncbi:unnamed protein product [Prunus armeniaca]|uniref:EF-hand domain-containing protein n=1 Tax=Prunus armeniaca TaxID=36596 RepID=A0A6J5Y582_PRUAR|nr:unnamed protein product [Prunus armeniaca]CAB4319557.1 unnamed protein product [Prunus armeniaca]
MVRKVQSYSASTYTEEQIKRVFERHRKNSDDGLSIDNLTTAFAELGVKWPVFRAWFAMWNADEDGNGFISTDKEFRELVKYALQFEYTVR